MSDESNARASDLELPAANRLRSFTPARVALGRTGVSLPTRARLDFDRCHALARDAVHTRLETAALAKTLRELTGLDVLCLHSAAPDRATYLQRPDLGRKLDEPSSRAISESLAESVVDGEFDLALIVADGLSALAIERHAAPMLQAFLPMIAGWRLAPLSVVEQGRVAIGDQIGAALGAQIAVILIGERPGLSSPDSLGVYITWDPRPGRLDAERNCISNIRTGGSSYEQAARQLSAILSEARRLRLTGIALKPQAQSLLEG
jgi:ethanolamine ammonia-lyase small subunit